MKTTEVYKDADELLANLPYKGNKIEIENEDEVIKSIKDRLTLLLANAEKPGFNTFHLYLSLQERIVFFNYLKNNNALDNLLTYNLYYWGNNYIYLNDR